MSNNGVYEAYVNPNRHRLEEVLPLDTPYIIHICASDICNFKCKFCGFQAEEANNYFKKQVMDKSVFEKIVDNCTEFPQKLKVIRFSGCGEPLVNKNIVEMISCARNKNIAERIEIITNGSFLNPTLNRQLVDAGLDALRISIDIFQRIYDGLEEWRDAGTPVKVVNLYAFGEPLLNGNLVEMLKRIKSGNVCREVRLTTNASLLTSELGHRLIDAGLDHLRVSVEALDSDGYKEICGANVSFEDIVEKISNYYDYSRNKGCYVDVKIVDAAFHTSEDENKFYDVFESISDTHFVERVEAIWPGFENVIIPENSVAEVKSTCRKYIDASERGICTFPFTDMIIHANGNVSPCCSDWSGALFYGNVAEQTLREIWNGENHRKLQIQHLNKQAYSTTICKECDRIPMDDITPYAAKLLEKFETHD